MSKSEAKPLSGWATFDIETETNVYMGRKASPFSPDNWIVSAAYKLANGPVVGSYWGADRKGSNGWLGALLRQARPKVLVGFNIKFDLLHLLQNEDDYQAYMDWVVEGGQLWDAQLVEYLLEGQVPEAQMLSLDEVAPRYGGSTKIDEVKALWAQGVPTHKIPRQLLIDYLEGRDLPDGTRDTGDVENTELAFLGQLAAARERGQLRSIQLNNGSLVATVEMEKNGLRVDVEKGRVIAAELAVSIAEAEVRLNEYLPKDLPFEFKWGSPNQKSALIFGGKIPYKMRVHERDEHGELAYAKKKVEAYVYEDGSTRPVAEVDAELEDGQTRVIKLPVMYVSGQKKGLFKTKQIDVPDPEKPKIYWRDFEWPMEGMVEPRDEWATKKPGVYSTSAEVIDELAGSGIPFLEDLGTVTKMRKDLGTYYITEEFDEETGEVTAAKGMLTLVQPDGIVHHSINHTNTVTGRFSSSNPNGQNLPRSGDLLGTKYVSRVKELFISRFPMGSMVSSDFTSLEVYMQANLTLDAQLVADLIGGLDMHCLRLSMVENKPYEEVLKLAVTEGVPLWKRKRTEIKVFSFQRAYGAGAEKISREVKREVEEVKLWIEKDNERYPGIVDFNNHTEKVVKKSRWPTAMWAESKYGRVRINLHRGELFTWDGKRYVFTESPSPKFLAKKGILQSFSPTELKNYPFQGMGGEWMKAAMWLAVRAFYFYRNFGGLGLLVNTVHDALYADADPSVRRKVGVVVNAAMHAASDFMEYWFDHQIEVPVPAVTEYGPSMFEEHHFEDAEAFGAASTRVQGWLRERYMAGYTPSYEEQA